MPFVLCPWPVVIYDQKDRYIAALLATRIAQSHHYCSEFLERRQRRFPWILRKQAEYDNGCQTSKSVEPCFSAWRIGGD
jgi:hypothetical protein